MGNHNRLIEHAARERLAPLGCHQMGRSRTWLDDHGWWVGVVEFQPSSWSKGSYLNVGACWLWDGSDHLSFDYGAGRIGAFESYQDDAQFQQAAEGLAKRAEAAVIRLRARIAGVRPLAWRLRLSLQPGFWGHYHAAVANGLAGKTGVARRRFRKILDAGEDTEWARDIKARSTRLVEALDDSPRFESEVRSMVNESRERLGLASPDRQWRFDAEP